MITVCKGHVVKGLRAISVPHVQSLGMYTTKTYCYCGKKAEVKLFLPTMITAKAM
ncbi:hypothetical protein [Ammoniphilus sp. YIM 78166]|uniref:hypothetical protein n=1 Tax=Ammoniphilus sp. YIM 78166 TaxID=1644106 RepID=UPI00142FAB6C|nr:hypothetical protein [Ammoniphilus sp. YIM 78166]